MIFVKRLTQHSYRYRRCLFASSTAISLLLLTADPAHATQQHGGAEGLISHQIGHILFLLGMCTILLSVCKRKLIGPGWPQFKIFLVSAILWNITTFSGHWAREYVAPEKFLSAEGLTRSFKVTTAVDAIFYFSSLDHIILAPAFLFLLLALRKWRSMS